MVTGFPPGQTPDEARLVSTINEAVTPICFRAAPTIYYSDTRSDDPHQYEMLVFERSETPGSEIWFDVRTLQVGVRSNGNDESELDRQVIAAIERHIAESLHAKIEFKSRSPCEVGPCGVRQETQLVHSCRPRPVPAS
jgi:hypothetical protein